MYPLFETLSLVDGIIQNQDWHIQRFERSYFEVFGKNPSFSLLGDLIIQNEFNSGKVRLRVLYGRDSSKYELERYFYKPISKLKLVEDGNINYSLKWTDRADLTRIWNLRQNADDVLITKKGMVTDTSYCNVVFFDGKQWITSDSPLLPGTAREKLLYQGKIISVPIHQEDLIQFKGFKLINALRTFEEEPLNIIENILT